MRTGTLAGIVGGRRRTALGQTWDARYHRYFGTGGCALWRYRPALRLERPAEAPALSPESSPVAEPLRLAS